MDCDYGNENDANGFNARPLDGGGGEPTDHSTESSMIPLIVEAPRDDVNLVWLCASRSTLSTGMSFAARGRRWVVTGLNPSGVTYRCREVPSAPSGESTAPVSVPGGSKQ